MWSWLERTAYILWEHSTIESPGWGYNFISFFKCIKSVLPPRFSFPMKSLQYSSKLWQYRFQSNCSNTRHTIYDNREMLISAQINWRTAKHMVTVILNALKGSCFLTSRFQSYRSNTHITFCHNNSKMLISAGINWQLLNTQTRIDNLFDFCKWLISLMSDYINTSALSLCFIVICTINYLL